MDDERLIAIPNLDILLVTIHINDHRSSSLAMTTTQLGVVSEVVRGEIPRGTLPVQGGIGSDHPILPREDDASVWPLNQRLKAQAVSLQEGFCISGLRKADHRMLMEITR